MQHSTIFVFSALISIFEGALGRYATAFINDSEVGDVDADKSDIQRLYELKNKVHVMENLVKAVTVKQNDRVKELRITGTEIQVYVEKSRIPKFNSTNQIEFEPLSAPLVVADKGIDGNDIMLTPEKVRAFLRTFGIWRQVHIYKVNPDMSNKLQDQGLQVKSSNELSSLWITFNKL
ncbi:hypothetical protein Ddc_13007 [Ditylenchus destructor]|nr:hypothetical protein Ddc_13007 [Ditylenchus destructor]